MRLRESRREQMVRDGFSLLAGSAVGFGIGFLLSRNASRQPREDLRERMRGAVRRLRPARRERLGYEQEDIDRLEERVLNEFLLDDVLSERAIDIGAISSGIIELTGAVRNEEETQRAVSLARRVPGVETVVNRIELEGSNRIMKRRNLDQEDRAGTFTHQEGRVGGMGRRRQSTETEPGRPDDSQRLRESALAAADREQWSEEGYVPVSGRDAEASNLREPKPTRFSEDELDNQDPHGKHAPRTVDEPPRELNSDARVGEGEKPGTDSLT